MLHLVYELRSGRIRAVLYASEQYNYTSDVEAKQRKDAAHVHSTD